jgi:methylmalonyl-CoA/ethylmalonyl-CoA epimerase
MEKLNLIPAHVGLSVNNAEQSIEWYRNVLGFELVKDDGFVPPLQARVCFLERDGFQLELFEYVQPKPLPADRLTPNSDLQTIGTKHVAFYVDDMSVVKAHLAEYQVDIAHEVNMGGEAVLFLRDCNGILIELIQR